MAIMIPLRYDPNNCTKGEGILFDRFNKSKNTDNCYIMHSYLLQDHRNQKYGEIDFLILAPNYGIFIIEVKSSHTIKVNKGTWYFYNKKGGLDYKKHISPFKQANENMHRGASLHSRRMLLLQLQFLASAFCCRCFPRMFLLQLRSERSPA